MADRGVVVVARYEENVDWTTRLPLGWEARIVQKGRDLPNVGREASSYLWYMATQDIDPEATYAFVQGDPFPHAFELSQLRRVDGYAPLGGHVLNADHDGHPHHGGLQLAEHLRRWIGTERPPPRFIFHAGGQFLLPGRVILARPRHWYAELQAAVAEGRGAWIMERLWPHTWPPELVEAETSKRKLQKPSPPAVPYTGPNLLELIHHGDPYAGSQVLPLDIQGWNGNDPAIGRLIDEVVPSLVVEVGSWKGQSAITMASRLRHYGGKVVCIDTWLGSQEFVDCPHRSAWLARRNGYPSTYLAFLSNVVQLGLHSTIVPFPLDSRAAGRWLAAHEVVPDMVYLDGSHEEEDVADDLVRYFGLLRPGGVIFGDDYVPDWPGVVAAVDQFARSRRLKVDTSSPPFWVIRKPRRAK